MNYRNRQAEKLYSRGFGSSTVVAVVLLVGALASVAWVYMGMVAHERWPIHWLEVDGAFERISAEQVRTRLSPLVNESYFTVDLEAIEAAASELAWVAGVSVQKTWPDTVNVSVHEYFPVAHWVDGALMSSAGQPFKVNGAAEMQGLPWLEGPPGSADQVNKAWLGFNNELMPTGLEIDLIKLDRRGAWYLRLNNGTEVNIGRNDAQQRLRRMVKSWAELTRLNEWAPVSIDLRYSNGFAVRWPEPPASLAANDG